MKSVLITFVIFFVIFALLKMNILDIFSNTIFHIISYASLITVVGCAIYFVGIPSRTKEIMLQNDDKNNDQKKEQNNDEN